MGLGFGKGNVVNQQCVQLFTFFVRDGQNGQKSKQENALAHLATEGPGDSQTYVL